jgi:hypothetical protein
MRLRVQYSKRVTVGSRPCGCPMVYSQPHSATRTLAILPLRMDLIFPGSGHLSRLGTSQNTGNLVTASRYLAT